MDIDKNSQIYSGLKLLNYGKHQFINSTELFDTDKLYFIISNPQIFKPLLIKNPRPSNTTYDPFNLSEKYLKRSRNGQVPVIYKQRKGVGRFHALYSLSLQCISRQIRHTICSDFYIDIDIHNAHPTILKFICGLKGYACPILTKYCDDRDGFCKNNNLETSEGKYLIIAIINGGTAEYNKIKNPSADLVLLIPEMKIIHNLIINDNRELYEKHKNERIEKKKTYNHEASFMNIILRDLENKILNVIYEYFKKDKYAVLCFDGIMLRKDIKYDLKGCEQEIFDKLNIRIILKVKPFEDAFDMSTYEIPMYDEIRLGFYRDKKHLIAQEIHIDFAQEWMNNSLVLIDNGGKQFFLTKNERYDSFIKENSIFYEQVKSDELLRSLKVKCNIINPYFDSEFLIEVQKMSKSEVSNLDYEDFKSLQKNMFSWLGNHSVKQKGYIADSMETNTLPNFNYVEFHPFLERKGIPLLRDSFNSFSGFPIENAYQFNVDYKNMFKNSKFYKHLKEELIGGTDDLEFEHLLDHIADIIQDPSTIKTNGHLFYTAQGMGKGMLAKFMSKLIGSDHVISFQNPDAYFGKFNAEQSSKLLKVFEEVSDKGAAFKNHDRLKGDQSMPKERIEPKGINAYHIQHCARFWYFTNNENALYIEGDDRRFTCHRANNRYAQNHEYFDPLWDEVNSNEFCRNAFEFFATREYTSKSVFNCYNTKFKTEQKELNLPNGLKFMKEMAETSFEFVDRVDDKIKVKDLNNTYRTWCEDNGVNFKVSTFKTQLRKLGIMDKTVKFEGKNTKCYIFTDDDLQRKYSTYLTDKCFKFDTVPV
jgi:hypothetical protein